MLVILYNNNEEAARGGTTSHSRPAHTHEHTPVREGSPTHLAYSKTKASLKCRMTKYP